MNVTTSYISQAKHCKYSISDGVYKIYHHKLYMLVSDLGELTAEQNAKLDTITDSKILNELLRNVARAESMEEVNVIFKAL